MSLTHCSSRLGPFSKPKKLTFGCRGTIEGLSYHLRKKKINPMKNFVIVILLCLVFAPLIQSQQTRSSDPAGSVWQSLVSGSGQLDINTSEKSIFTVPPNRKLVVTNVWGGSNPNGYASGTWSLVQRKLSGEEVLFATPDVWVFGSTPINSAELVLGTGATGFILGPGEELKIKGSSNSSMTLCWSGYLVPAW
jgi:hypothetical protein